MLLSFSISSLEVPEPQYSDSEVVCLAKNIYYESRGEPLEGRKAVAQVTLNRVKQFKGTKTICDIVYAKKQFSWTIKPGSISDKEAWKSSKLLANSMLNWHNDYNWFAAVYFHTSSITPYWAKNKHVYSLIGTHKFYL